MTRRWIGATIIAIAFLLQSGCATSRRNIDLAREAFATGDLLVAEETLGSLAHSRRRISDAAALDLAMVHLASGNPGEAEKQLRTLRDRFDAAAKVAPLSEVASIVTDDNVRHFRPAGYEQVMIRAMLAVCSMATDGLDAESYALQAAMRHSELAREAEKRGVLNVDQSYQAIALAPYLRGVLREATHHDYDDAAKAYQLVSAVEPRFIAAREDIARAIGGSHSQPGHGVLYVIACVGRGPVLQEVVAPTTTSSLQIASSVLNSQTNNDPEKGAVVALPNIASVKVPRVVIPPSSVIAIGARSDGVAIGVTQTLTDVGQLAARQIEAEMPWIIARAVARRVTKETTVATAGNQLGLSGTAGSLFHFAASSLWSSTEHADTRCWGLLPREIQVLRVELPVGERQISLCPIGSTGHPLSNGFSKKVVIVDGRNEYMVVIAPDKIVYGVN